ncbi:MAG: DUF6345 domain-containing protein [Nitrososphaeria archaeon]
MGEYVFNLRQNAFLIILSFLLLSSLKVYSYNTGGAMTFEDDYNDFWYNQVDSFLNIIDSYPNWNKLFSRDYPNVGPYMYVEEANNGLDDSYADKVEISIILGHTAVVLVNGNYYTAIGFGAGKGAAIPQQVRLGYQSPDNKGEAIWAFIIQCELLHDDQGNQIGVGGWTQTLTGLHMLLGFKNSPAIVNGDIPELAKRLTGTGGFPKEKVQDAFFHTFVDSDHPNNIARIVAESTSVVDNDVIDNFNEQIPVDGTKIIITCWYTG